MNVGVKKETIISFYEDNVERFVALPVKSAADVFDTINMYKAETVSIGVANTVRLNE